MRQGSKIREEQNRNNSFAAEETVVGSNSQKGDSSGGQGGRVPRLDMAKVINNSQGSQNKPKAVYAKPDEAPVKEEQAKPLDAQANINGQTQQKQPSSQITKEPQKDAISNKTNADKKTAEPGKDQKANGNLNNVKGNNPETVSQMKKEESKGDPAKNRMSEKKPDLKKEESKGEDLKTPELKKNASSFKAMDLKVSPDIFVSLKTGSIGEYYKVGQVLGEGNFFLSLHQVLIYFNFQGLMVRSALLLIEPLVNYPVSVDYRLIIPNCYLGIVRAMKSIKKKSVLREEQEKLFAEVSILKELDHPNIVKLYELFQDNECYYLITE